MLQHRDGRVAGMRRLLLVLAMGAAAPVWADDIVVIVNKDNTHPVDLSVVRSIYIGALGGWPDGSRVFALDQPANSDAREQFCANVMHKSCATLRVIWSQNIFTGKGLPPKVVDSDGVVKRMVAADAHAIGYIHVSQVDASVKVVDK